MYVLYVYINIYIYNECVSFLASHRGQHGESPAASKPATLHPNPGHPGCHTWLGCTDSGWFRGFLKGFLMIFCWFSADFLMIFWWFWWLMDWFCWENLQETRDFPMKVMGFSYKISLKPIHWDDFLIRPSFLDLSIWISSAKQDINSDPFSVVSIVIAGNWGHRLILCTICFHWICCGLRSGSLWVKADLRSFSVSHMSYMSMIVYVWRIFLCF